VEVAMPINTATIDAQITKQRDHLKKLEDFRRFASDPEMLPLLQSLIMDGDVASSATHRAPGRPKGSQNKKGSKKGDLKNSVIKTIGGISGKFTAPGVVKIMDGDGVKFAAQNPNIAVNGVLRKLVAKGTLRIAVEGSGRAPNQYERVGKG
jgi:hypothetical protein